MARTKKYVSKRKTTTKVQNTLRYITGIGHSDVYLDLASALSKTNRKLFSQEYCYNVKNIRFRMPDLAGFDSIQIQAITAGETWAVHNAWTKGKALHTQMQNLVLEDNPSIKGKWAEFKVYLDPLHPAAGSRMLQPVDANGTLVMNGEWNYSTFVMPQHEVDPATGLPLPADEVTSHLIGDDTPGFSMGLVKAYAQSRATVQPSAPAVPASMANSFFNLLTDSGSQEPELATVIEGENDQPPYHESSYPGGASNANAGWTQSLQVVNDNSPNGNLGSFAAPCGLVHLRIQAFLNGESVSPPIIAFEVVMSKGSYKGLSAEKMGQ